MIDLACYEHLFTKAELLTILDLILKISKSENMDEFSQLLYKFEGFASFDRVWGISFGRIEYKDGRISAIDDIGNIFQLNMKEDLLQAYMEENAMYDDALYQQCFLQRRPLFATECLEVMKNEKSIAVFNKFCVEMYKEGITMSINPTVGMKSGLIFGGNHFERNERNLVLGHLVGYNFCSALLRINAIKGEHYSARISKREREVLKWMAQGKTNWEIAKILNISQNTVAYHKKNIFSKLNSHNSSQAIAKGVELGIVYF